MVSGKRVRAVDLCGKQCRLFVNLPLASVIDGLFGRRDKVTVSSCCHMSTGKGGGWGGMYCPCCHSYKVGTSDLEPVPPTISLLIGCHVSRGMAG